MCLHSYSFHAYFDILFHIEHFVLVFFILLVHVVCIIMDIMIS